YKRLPNDTDFTVFKATGYQGFNFAYVGNATQYHTPLDNFANADPGSLQHHGDNALALVRALAAENLDHLPRNEAVFFDVFAKWIISWPISWTMWLAALALGLLIATVLRLIRRGHLQASEMLWGLLAWFLMMVVSALTGIGLSWALRAGGAFPSVWIAHPRPALIAFWYMGFAWVGIFAACLRNRAGFWGLWSGVWIWWSILSLICAWILPGISFVFLVPSLAAGVFALPLFLGSQTTGKRMIATIVPLVMGSVLGVSAIFYLYDSLGRPFLFAFAVLLALIVSPLSPLLGDLRGRALWAFPFLALIVSGFSLCTAFVVTPYTRSVQQAMNILYLQDADSGKSQWIVFPNSGRLPVSFRQTANFGFTPVKAFHWLNERGYSADAPRLDLPAPDLKISLSSESAGKRVYHATMLSQRDAPKEYLLFPPSELVEAVSIEGTPVPPITDSILRYTNGWHIYDLVDTAKAGVEVDFTIRGTSPPQIYLMDKSYGLPLEATAILKSRPPEATPIHDGDGTIVIRRVQLPR
ncbi:MAG: M28 family peptidase, partial [Candidatus Acidiferrales bacterium]